MKTQFIFALAATAFVITGCIPNTKSEAADAAIDQANLCEVSDWRAEAVASACKPGQKVVFLPSSFGNQQLPIYFAAVNCDLRYQVALTTGAVTCIYYPITTAAQNNESPASAAKP